MREKFTQCVNFFTQCGNFFTQCGNTGHAPGKPWGSEWQKRVSLESKHCYKVTSHPLTGSTLQLPWLDFRLSNIKQPHNKN